jgi:hypothetical protein
VATPYAELDDLTDRFPRDLTSTEEDRAETLLADASFWLGVWVPGLADTTDETVLEAAKLLVVAMARRSLIAQAQELPGVQSTAESWGSYNQSVTYRNPEGNLYLYGTELDNLLGLLRGNRAAAVSMRSPGL